MEAFLKEAFYKGPFCREAFLTGGLFEKAFLIRGLLSGRPFWCYPIWNRSWGVHSSEDNVAILINFPLVCKKVCNLWFPGNPWVEEKRAVEQIVMCGWRFLVKASFKKKPRIEEAVDAWQTWIREVIKGFCPPSSGSGSCWFCPHQIRDQ